MKVKEIMTVNPKACTTTTNLAEAASFMWDYDCGILPVVADGTLEGVLSISDITLNAKETTGNKVPEISFRDVVQTYKAICAHVLSAEQAFKSMTATA